jgi:pentatricopeptide repeat protein
MASGPAQSRNSFAPRQDNRPRREQRDPSRTGGNYGNNSGSARGAQGRMASQQRLRDITFQYQPDLEFRSGQIGTSLQRRNMELGRHAAASRLQAVVRLCADMKADGVTPDVTTYHYLLRVLAEHGMHKECLATLEDMEAIGITPDLQAYHYTMQVSRTRAAPPHCSVLT